MLYRAAVGAVVSGSFLFGGTVLNFAFAALAALVIGIGAAWLIAGRSAPPKTDIRKSA